MGFIDEAHPDEAYVRAVLRQLRSSATRIESAEVAVSEFLRQYPSEALANVREADVRLSPLKPDVRWWLEQTEAVFPDQGWRLPAWTRPSWLDDDEP